MTDFADEASERTEAQIAAALSNRMPEGPVARGLCLECDEPFTKAGKGSRVLEADMERRWCDAQCRDMWERRNG
jgi:hypothetical protein